MSQSTGEAHQRDHEMPVYVFGRYRLDPGCGALFRDGHEVPLRPKSFEVLLHLVRRRGVLVGKDELFATAWPGLVVTDDSLTQCVTEIRKSLGDHERQIIRTVLRRGYVFQAEVREEQRQSAKPALPERDRGTSPTRAPSTWTLVGLGVLAVAVAAAWWRLTQGPFAPDWHPPPASIAVLPFADMSEAGDQQYLADGIAEEILNMLAQSPELTVIARTSSFAVNGRNTDIGTIARLLNVANVLEGSVRKAGDRVRVTAQLVDGVTGAHIWSETFEGGVSDIFALQDRVASEVARLLHVELAAMSRSPDPHAWEAYLTGKLFYSRRGEGDILRAQRSFERAVELDPGLADAWVALAATINVRRRDSNIEASDRLSEGAADPLIRSALEKALAIDPENPEALWRHAYYLWQEGRRQETLDQVAEAVRLGHNHAMVHAMMAGFAFDLAHTEMAVKLIRRAIILDPIAAQHRRALVEFLLSAGQLAEAEVALQQVLELNPENGPFVSAQLTWIRIMQGDFVAAESYAAQLPPGLNRDQALAMLGHARAGDPSGDEALARLAARPASEAAERLAFVYAFRGDLDEAFRWLDIARDAILASQPGRAGRGNLMQLQHALLLAPLHADPRWSAWVARNEGLALSETDLLILEVLRAHLKNHPELYGQAQLSPVRRLLFANLNQ